MWDSRGRGAALGRPRPKRPRSCSGEADERRLRRAGLPDPAGLRGRGAALGRPRPKRPRCRSGEAEAQEADELLWGGRRAAPGRPTSVGSGVRASQIRPAQEAEKLLWGGRGAAPGRPRSCSGEAEAQEAEVLLPGGKRARVGRAGLLGPPRPTRACGHVGQPRPTSVGSGVRASQIRLASEADEGLWDGGGSSGALTAKGLWGLFRMGLAKKAPKI